MRGSAFSRRQANDCGLSDCTLKHAVIRGDLVKVGHGAYVQQHAWEAATFERRHALTALALLDANPGFTAGFETALALHGLPIPGAEQQRCHFFSDTQQVRRSKSAVYYPRHGVVEAVGQVHGLAEAIVTTLAVRVKAGVVAGDAALRQGLVSREELHGAAQTAHELRVSRLSLEQLTQRLHLLTPRAESPKESLLRLALVGEGFIVEPQYEPPAIRGARRYRVDLGVWTADAPHEVVGVEYDGEDKYAEGWGVVSREKERENAVREAGVPIVRVRSKDLRNGAGLAMRIRYVARQFYAHQRAS